MSNPVQSKSRLTVFVVGMLAIISVIGFVLSNAGRANAATGAPSIGNFEAGSASCTTQLGPTPSIQFSGVLETSSETMLGAVAVPDPERTSLLSYKGVVFVWVNDQPIEAITNPGALNPGFYYRLPGWDGKGKKPSVTIKVSNPTPSDEIRFSLAWLTDGPSQLSQWYTLLVAGSVAEGCGEIASNPAVPYAYNYIPTN